MSIYYEALFMDQLKGRLKNVVEKPIIKISDGTLERCPDLFGTKVRFVAAEYANNGFVEGYKLIPAETEDKESLERLGLPQVCYLAVSTNEGGDIEDLSSLQFEKLIFPFIVPSSVGKFEDGRKKYN